MKQKAHDISTKFRKQLLLWFQKHKRPLPFRKTKDPYKIWLSEIMLQQTTMNAVIDYYKKFIKRFPNIQSVASASEEELLNYWQGLGYYSRVRNFQKGCKQVLKDFSGKVPTNYTELLKLKGIGEYTAAAISSICFQKPHAVIDGNVKRVIARLFEFDKDINSKEAKTYFFEKANQLLDKNHPGDFNEAIMELGALVCRPKSPTCLTCPVNDLCQSYGKDPERFPKKQKQNFIDVNYHALVIARENEILLKKPAENNLLKNMWEIPGIYNHQTSENSSLTQLLGTKYSLQELPKLGKVKHSITNKKIITHIYKHKSVPFSQNEFKWIPFDELDDIPLSTLSKKIMKKCKLR